MISGRGIAPTRCRRCGERYFHLTGRGGHQLGFAWSLPRHQAKDTRTPQVRIGSEAPPGFAETTAFRNSSLQGAYFIIAARAIGLDCGPMSGFDNEAVDREFFPGGQ